jgi:hypothetical protein
MCTCYAVDDKDSLIDHFTDEHNDESKTTATTTTTTTVVKQPTPVKSQPIIQSSGRVNLMVFTENVV